MGYRGEDLDLRTPQTWSASQADLTGAGEVAAMTGGARGAVRSGPIWVDDTVLACSNHAFDVALAHRAGEVRIEHLLHALTRIDAASEALEARGVRVAALRRESATIIANEIPVGLPNGKGVPRRSEEFAEVLRLAAANAARRNAPAGIEDLLYVLFDQRSELPGLSLLHRNTMRGTREILEPLPPLTRYTPEPPRYSAPPVERYVRVEPAQQRYAVEAPRPYRSEYAGTPTDSIQNTRIDALEQMVRALGNDLSNERQTFSAMLKDIGRDAQSHRDDQGRMHSGLYDRLENLEKVMTSQNQAPQQSGAPVEDLIERMQSVEASLQQRLNDMSRSWTVLSDRLQSLEHAVREASDGTGVSSDIVSRITAAVDLKPIANRLDIIEEALLSREPAGDHGIGERMRTLEGEITRALGSNAASTARLESLVSGFERQRADLVNQLAGPVIDRVSSITTAHAGQISSVNDTLVRLAERVDAVERAVAAEIETAAAKHQAYAQDLTKVHEALMKLNQNQVTLAGSIDQWHTESAGDVAVISTKLAAIDRDASRPMEMLGNLNAQMDVLNRTMIERYHRRNRFWYWLFGTDDWLGRSWPSQAAAIEAEKQRLKSIKPKTA
jgi:hypothetical protein